MKLSAIIVTVLCIIATAHGFNPDRSINFQQNIQYCLEIENKTPSRIDSKILKCALTFDGQVFDKNNQIRRAVMVALIIDIIDDGYQSMMAQTLFRDCCNNENVDDNISNDQETTKIIECFSSIKNYITLE
ncbi:uncharacterized protein LOC116853083 [Odontomachus brunneus]|uniref:uncharacterized protein LOC116853083 n=1 Tax=Odontomachus brunneus TaxID=486640 RepID=UPI0013F2061E|nr:uncharacterized protein LOC116853083 [Odontomachus brunneus]